MHGATLSSEARFAAHVEKLSRGWAASTDAAVADLLRRAARRATDSVRGQRRSGCESRGCRHVRYVERRA